MTATADRELSGQPMPYSSAELPSLLPSTNTGPATEDDFGGRSYLRISHYDNYKELWKFFIDEKG